MKRLIQSIIHMYEALEEKYGDETALWAATHDLRYWIFLSLRSIQKAFVELNPPHEMDEEKKYLASKDFSKFDAAISKLLEIRRPLGDDKVYENPTNPYS